MYIFLSNPFQNDKNEIENLYFSVGVIRMPAFEFYLFFTVYNTKESRTEGQQYLKQLE